MDIVKHTLGTFALLYGDMGFRAFARIAKTIFDPLFHAFISCEFTSPAIAVFSFCASSVALSDQPARNGPTDLDLRDDRA
jgi:hypothetical protein